MRYAAAQPVRVRALSPLLNCDTLAVYGYRARAGDKYVGPLRRSMRAARHDAREHNRASKGAPQ